MLTPRSQPTYKTSIHRYRPNFNTDRECQFKQTTCVDWIWNQITTQRATENVGLASSAKSCRTRKAKKKREVIPLGMRSLRSIVPKIARSTRREWEPSKSALIARIWYVTETVYVNSGSHWYVGEDVSKKAGTVSHYCARAFRIECTGIWTCIRIVNSLKGWLTLFASCFQLRAADILCD